MNPALFVYPSTDCTMNGCAWIGGTQPEFQHANKDIVFLKIVSCISVVSIRASQVPFCYWNVHKIFVYLKSVLQIIAKIMKCTVKTQNLWNIFACVLENFSGPNVDYTSKMAECSFSGVAVSHTYYFTEYCCSNHRVL